MAKWLAVNILNIYTKCSLQKMDIIISHGSFVPKRGTAVMCWAFLHRLPWCILFFIVYSNGFSASGLFGNRRVRGQTSHDSMNIIFIFRAGKKRIYIYIWFHIRVVSGNRKHVCFCPFSFPREKSQGFEHRLPAVTMSKKNEAATSWNKTHEFQLLSWRCFEKY